MVNDLFQKDWPSTRCSSCGAPIVWAVTDAGKRIPVDVATSARGNLALVSEWTQGGTVLRASVVKPGDVPLCHLSHFATCVNAALHRRPRG